MNTEISKISFKCEILTETLVCFVTLGFLDILIISSVKNTNVKYIKKNIKDVIEKGYQCDNNKNKIKT